MESKVYEFLKVLDHSIRQDLVCCFKAKEAKVVMDFDGRKLRIFISTSAIIKSDEVKSEISIDYYYIKNIVENNDDVVPYINALTALIVCDTVGYKDKYQKIYRKCE
jgi:hypothetical protein